MIRIYALAGLTALLVILAVAAGFGLSTGWAVRALENEAMTRLGRTLTIKDGASLEFSPRLALRFDGVELGNPEGFEGPFITSPTLRVPVSLGDILRRRLAGRFELQSPDISLEIGGKGDVTWAGPAKGPPLPVTESFLIEDGTIRFYDQRNQQSIRVAQVNAAGRLSPEGEFTLEGNATLGGRLSGFTAYVKDLGRVATTGSPFDLSIDAPPLALAFNGRLSTAGALNLAGPATLSGKSLREVAAWIGSPISGGRGLGAFSIAATLDSNGTDFALRNATILLDDMAARGDIGMTMNRLSPLVFAKLAVPELALGKYIDSVDPQTADWSTAPLSYAGLRGLNARLTLMAGRLSLGAIAADAATVEASLADGKLAAVISSDSLAGGRGRIDLELDGTSNTPLFSARLVANSTQALSLLQSFTGHTWITGTATADVSVSGFGTSVAAIVSTLKGEATFDVRDGRLQGVDARALLAGVSQKIIEGWTEADGSTPFSSLTGSFTIADGIGETKDLNVSGDNLTIPLTGRIDLLRRAVDLSANPMLASGGDAVGLPVPVIIKGPWGAPRLYPDVADILLKPAEAFAKLKAMGLPAQTGGN